MGQTIEPPDFVRAQVPPRSSAAGLLDAEAHHRNWPPQICPGCKAPATHYVRVTGKRGTGKLHGHRFTGCEDCAKAVLEGERGHTNLHYPEAGGWKVEVVPLVPHPSKKADDPAPAWKVTP